MTVEDIHGRIRSLAAERNLSIYELAKRAGLAESTIYNLFERGTMPKIETLEKLCDAMEVSLSDFFVFLSKPGRRIHMTGDEIALMEIHSGLSKKNRERLMIYAQAMADTQEPVKKSKKR